MDCFCFTRHFPLPNTRNERAGPTHSYLDLATLGYIARFTECQTEASSAHALVIGKPFLHVHQATCVAQKPKPFDPWNDQTAERQARSLVGASAEALWVGPQRLKLRLRTTSIRHVMTTATRAATAAVRPTEGASLRHRGRNPT